MSRRVVSNQTRIVHAFSRARSILENRIAFTRCNDFLNTRVLTRSLYFTPTTVLRNFSTNEVTPATYEVEILNIERSLGNMKRSIKKLNNVQRMQSGEDGDIGAIDTRTPIKDKEDAIEEYIEKDLVSIAEQIESIAAVVGSRTVSQLDEDADQDTEEPTVKSELLNNLISALKSMQYLERKEIARKFIARIYDVLKRMSNELKDLEIEKLPDLQRLCYFELNTFLYNSLMEPLGKIADKQMIVMLLAEMKERKVLADARTYHHLISAAVNADDMETANKIVNYIAKVGIEPLPETFKLLTGEVDEEDE